MLTLVQIICSKYAPGSRHSWTNKLRRVWLAFIHCWVPAVKALCEQPQLVRDKNHWSSTARECMRCRYLTQTENLHII